MDKRERAQINTIRNEKGEVTVDTTEIQRIVRDYNKQLYSSMEVSRQEYWSGLAFPSPGDPPDPGIEPRSPALQTESLPTEPPRKPNGSSVLF